MHLLLATHGWWPWLLLYAFIIGVVAAGVVYFVRQHRTNKTSTTTTPSDAPALVSPAEPPAAQTPPDLPAEHDPALS